MCFYARKSPIQFGFMPWSFIFKYEVQSSPVKSSQVKPMCFYTQEIGLLAAALVISWRFDLCQVKPMCFYARKSPIQFGFMPWLQTC
uniref:Uncharacterized protein n=1 Tax=Daphnia galeata TaxID=27404 RepID=A0A8J2RRQ0_9CRUS|nr:unnamed protein product [Daphnia galeata]